MKSLLLSQLNKEKWSDRGRSFRFCLLRCPGLLFLNPGIGRLSGGQESPQNMCSLQGWSLLCSVVFFCCVLSHIPRWGTVPVAKHYVSSSIGAWNSAQHHKHFPGECEVVSSISSTRKKIVTVPIFKCLAGKKGE